MKRTASARDNNTAPNRRLQRDYLQLRNEPVPYVTAAPLSNNLLEWHYVIKGPESSHYAGGYYHGRLVFPKEYPFKPPSIFMITPSGRFNCNMRLCLTMSDYHPETWNPSWTVAGLLTGLLSFMLEESFATGAFTTSASERSKLAQESLAFNLKDTNFVTLFPEIAEEIREKLKEGNKK